MSWGVSKLYYFIFRNTKHVLKHKVAIKREAAVTKDMNKEVICFWILNSKLSFQKIRFYKQIACVEILETYSHLLLEKISWK